MDSTQKILDKIELIKNSLTKNKVKNSEGLISVDRTEFADVFSELVKIYIYAIQVKNNSNSIDWDLFNTLFSFQDLQLDFSYETIVNKTYSKINNLDDVLTSHAHKLLGISFSNCRFIHFYLDRSFNRYFISNISINDESIIQEGRLDSHAFSDSFSFTFYCQDTIINNMVFIGHGRDHIFQKPFLFKHCTFSYTLRTAGKCIFNCDVRFVECSFVKESKSTFQKLTASGCSFNNADFLDSLLFHACDFYQSPKFHNAKLHSDTSFHLTKFHDTESPTSVGDYRALKQSTHDLGAEHDFMKFHALEMESRRNTALPNWKNVGHPEWTQTIASWFLKGINDYGRNFWSPWIWLSVIFTIFGSIYYLSDGIGCNLDKLGDSDIWLKSYCSEEGVVSLKSSYIYSFQRLWGPLGLIFDSGLLSPKVFWVKIISTLQFILSSVIWFILIVQIRRQFRL